MRIQEGDKSKTVYRIRYGHVKYQIMFFGIFNTLANFHKYINKMLAKKLDIFVILYLNNILIYIKDLGQSHVDVVRWVLEQLQKYVLFVNLKKGQFHEDKIRFISFVILTQCIRIEEERIEAVKS